MGLRVFHIGGMEAVFKFGKALPFFVHAGVAWVVNPAKVVDVASILSIEHGGPGEEGGGKVFVSLYSRKSQVVGGDAIVF